MIEKFVQEFEKRRADVLAQLRAKHPGSYKAIVEIVLRAINPDDDYALPDPARIHQIDDGDYQGTLLFVVAGIGYQPSDYWSVAVSYGSCSGCDTLQAISGYTDEAPTETQANEYMQLAVNVLQGFRKIAGYEL